MSETQSQRTIENWPGLVLGLFTLVGVGLVAMGHLGTADAIAQRRAEDLQRSLSQVIPPAQHDNDLLQQRTTLSIGGNPTEAFIATRNGEPVAVAFSVISNEGYGGPMALLLGVDLQGRLLGVRVLRHSETPGLGDKIEAERSDWIDGFKGLGLDNTPAAQWAVTKDGGRFDAFAGATITPRAVVKAVHRALQSFENQRAALAAPVKQESSS